MTIAGWGLRAEVLAWVAVGCMLGAVLALAAFPGAASADFTATEGQSFTGQVASIAGCEGFAGGIAWGDGTPASAAVVDGNGADGTHTYADEGTYGGTLTYTCGTFVQHTTSFQATVQDAPLTATGRNIAGAPGQALTRTVAHFTDTNAGGAAGDFSATIRWGDGTTTTGTITASPTGGFDLTGTHIYATTGSFPLSVSVTDDGGSTAAATAVAAIASQSSPPQVVRIDPLGRPGAGAPIVLKAVLTGTVTAIQWNLAGGPKPEITCSGAQTAVTFRAPAGTRSVTALAIGPAGSGSPLTTAVDIAPVSGLSAAQRRLAGKVAGYLAKKAPVYACAAPGDFVPVRVGSRNLSDRIETRGCATPRTVVEGGLQFEGCLRRVDTFSQIPSAERGIIFPVGNALRVPLNASRLRNVVIQLTDVYVTFGPVKVNGLTLTPGPAASVLVASQFDKILSSDAQTSVGTLDLNAPRSFMMNLSPRGGEIPLGSFARAAGGLGAIAGFALGGTVDVALDDSSGGFGLTIHVHLELPSFLQVGGVSAQGDVTLRSTNADGLVIDSLRIGPIDAEVAGLGVDGLQLDYTRANQEWAGQGSACVSTDGPCLDMKPPNGGVVIRNGSLVRAEASIDFPDPGIELFAGVALNRIGFGIGLDPTRLLANAKITAEGVLEIDGHLVLAFPSEATPFILDRAEVGDAFPADFYNRRYTRTVFAIGADAFFDLPLAGRTKLGGAYLLYQAPGYVGFGGGIAAHFAGIVDLTGRVDGEFNFANGRFSIKGDIEACLADIVCAGAIGAISDHGAGGCVHIGTFLGDINIGGGVGFSPFHIYLWPFDGCRWSPFVDTGVFPSRDARTAAAGASIPVKIKPGEASRAIELDGVGGAPEVRVHTPDGKVLASSAASGLALSPAIRILRSEKMMMTVVGLVHPAPGTYSIELLPGSPTVKTMSEASDQPAARVSATVQGRGARRTLSYNVARRLDQRVTFIEQAQGGSRIIGTINGGGRGRLGFTPAPGNDRRTIIAQFDLAGLPAETVRLASFRPPSPHLGKPTHLRVTRHGLTLAITWRAVPGATAYEIVARLTSGAERVIRTHHLAISLKGVAGFDGGLISVRAVATMREGKPTLRRLPRLGHAPTRFGRLPRPPRGR